jgi:putative membrane protein
MQSRVLLRADSLDRIEAAVADAEKLTSCEYVVVIAPASSRYEGRVIKAAAAIAVIVFIALYWLNGLLFDVDTDPLLLLLEAVVAGGLSALLFSRVHVLRRLLIPRWAMRSAVDAAAHSTFSVENVSLTNDRNAIMLYVSVLEGEVRLMPDIGAQKTMHEGALGEVEGMLKNARDGDPVELVCEAIRKLGGHCKDCFPRQADDKNELPDRPQIRLP